ncbi:MAG TPA: hypothetical protein VNK07_00055 [Candidatus Binatia bacterium]|jgi:hypothetical protein|nr:hypothetical protein [Candidatus Binatia bacterium]
MSKIADQDLSYTVNNDFSIDFRVNNLACVNWQNKANASPELDALSLSCSCTNNLMQTMVYA